MAGLVLGLIFFLIILAGAYKFGNPNNYIQKEHNKNFTDNVVYELERIIEQEKEGK